jgi:hypothetical protein
MIAKKSARRWDGDSSFQQLAGYLLDQKHNGEKVQYPRISHCLCEDPEVAIKEIAATQAQNQRAKSDKTYHLIVSFRAGEKPTPEQLADIEDQLCTALGFSGHQRLSAVHNDTDNLHLHLAINKIHPETLCLHEPYRDYHTLDQLCREMEIKHRLEVDNRIPGREAPTGKPGDMESHTGLESFTSWLKGEPTQAVAKTLENPSADWAALHQTLARYNLQLRQRGAGFVISDRDRKLHAKASALARELGKQKLEKRLGPYQARTEQAKNTPAQNRYQKAPFHIHPARQALYVAYQTHRNAVLLEKRQRLAALKGDHQRRLDSLRAAFAVRRRQVQLDPALPRGGKRAAYSLLKIERLAETERLLKHLATQRKAIYAEPVLPTWASYLQEQAVRGNETALAVLRSARRRPEKSQSGNLLQSPDGEGHPLLFQNYRYRIDRNGNVTYTLGNGGEFRDEGRRLRMSDLERDTLEAALRMGQAKFGNRLELRGSEDFKRRMLETATQRNIRVTFTDPTVDLACQQRQSPLPAGRDAIQTYIDARNTTRTKVMNRLPHRRYSPDDAGALTYQGQRNLPDGTRAVLLEKQTEMLVMPITDTQAAQLTPLKRGTRLTVDRSGAVVQGLAR